MTPNLFRAAITIFALFIVVVAITFSPTREERCSRAGDVWLTTSSQCLEREVYDHAVKELKWQNSK